MKLWKRFGAAVLAALTLTATLTGTALAEEEPVLISAPAADVAVQLNGEALAFTDAVPEITGDRTFLPFRAVLEAMGAQVGYDEQSGTVTAQRGDVKLELVPGQTRLTVTEGDQTRTVEMDVAPYIKESNGRTYIPVRYAAEAFGYNVGWDHDDRTVIMADVDALFGDATFALMDNFAAYCGKQEAAVENMSLTGNLAVDLTDKTGTMLTEPLSIKGSLEGVSSEKGIQLAGKIDGKALGVIFSSALGGPMDIASLYPDEVSGELRMDLDSKMLYFMYHGLPNSIAGGTGDTWYSLDLGAYEEQLLSMAGLDMAQLTQMEDASVREALVWAMGSIPLDDKDVSYSTLAEMAKLYVSMLSDQAFTQEGDAYVLRTTLEDTVNLEITLSREGEDIVAMDLTMTASAEEEGGRMSMTMTEHAAPDKVDVVMDMALESGEMDAAFHMDLNCAPTGKAPEIQPPAGAQVVPLDQMVPAE